MLYPLPRSNFLLLKGFKFPQKTPDEILLVWRFLGLNVGVGQSIRTQKLTIRIEINRPNAIAPTGWFGFGFCLWVFLLLLNQLTIPSPLTDLLYNK